MCVGVACLLLLYGLLVMAIRISASVHLRAVVVVNELRSQSVHARFLELFEPHFAVRKVPRGKMDAVHQHPAIDIFVMKLRRPRSTKQAADVADGNTDRADTQACEDAPREQPRKPGEAAASADCCKAVTAEMRGAESAAGSARRAAHTSPTGLDGEKPAEDQLSRQLDALESDGQQLDPAIARAAPGCESSTSGLGDGGAIAPQSQTTVRRAPAPTAPPDAGSDPKMRTEFCALGRPIKPAEAWLTRRQGAEAARLLANIRLPVDEHGKRCRSTTRRP